MVDGPLGIVSYRVGHQSAGWWNKGRRILKCSLGISSFECMLMGRKEMDAENLVYLLVLY
jgi:hypothetical protein